MPKITLSEAYKNKLPFDAISNSVIDLVNPVIADDKHANVILLSNVKGNVHDVHGIVKGLGDVSIIKCSKEKAFVEFLHIYKGKSIDDLVEALKPYNAVKYANRPKVVADIVLSNNELSKFA